MSIFNFKHAAVNPGAYFSSGKAAELNCDIPLWQKFTSVFFMLVFAAFSSADYIWNAKNHYADSLGT